MARPDGTTEGFNVDLAEAIAKRLKPVGDVVIDPNQPKPVAAQ